MPSLRYWIAMYLVMTAAVPSGIYLGRRLLLSHETAVIPTATAMPPRYRPDNK